jgi:hypothetical protein
MPAVSFWSHAAEQPGESMVISKAVDLGGDNSELIGGFVTTGTEQYLSKVLKAIRRCSWLSVPLFAERFDEDAASQGGC